MIVHMLFAVLNGGAFMALVVTLVLRQDLDNDPSWFAGTDLEGIHKGNLILYLECMLGAFIVGAILACLAVGFVV
jgi:hypothetical protein